MRNPWIRFGDVLSARGARLEFRKRGESDRDGRVRGGAPYRGLPGIFAKSLDVLR